MLPKERGWYLTKKSKKTTNASAEGLYKGVRDCIRE